jgi:hypothetical protein
MTTTLLITYIAILTVLFIVALAVIFVATIRSRKSTTNVQSGTDPMPDASRRNYLTRTDKDASEVPQQDMNGKHSDTVPSHDEGSSS